MSQKSKFSQPTPNKRRKSETILIIITALVVISMIGSLFALVITQSK